MNPKWEDMNPRWEDMRGNGVGLHTTISTPHSTSPARIGTADGRIFLKITYLTALHRRWDPSSPIRD